MAKCSRCGRPYQPDDKDFAHRNCDEAFASLSSSPSVDAWLEETYKRIFKHTGVPVIHQEPKEDIGRKRV